MPKKTQSSAGSHSHRRTRGASVRPPATGAGCTCSPLETTEPPVVSPPGRTEPRPVTSTGAQAPRTHRELAQAIFSECSPVQVGRELLQSGSDKGAAVRARVFETLANWHFGKPGAPAAGNNVRVIWDVPRPPHEHRDDE